VSEDRWFYYLSWAVLADEMCQLLDALVFAKHAGILVVCRGFLQIPERRELVQVAGENRSV
jgi:hypothetical protein